MKEEKLFSLARFFSNAGVITCLAGFFLLILLGIALGMNFWGVLFFLIAFALTGLSFFLSSVIPVSLTARISVKYLTIYDLAFPALAFLVAVGGTYCTACWMLFGKFF